MDPLPTKLSEILADAGFAAPAGVPVDELKTDILAFFNLDCCERLMLIEEKQRSNTNAECRSLVRLKRACLAGNADWENFSQQATRITLKVRTAIDSEDNDAFVLYGAVNTIFAPDAVRLLDSIVFFYMMRMPRWAGAFIDVAREKERKWMSDRIAWWATVAAMKQESIRTVEEAETLLPPPEEATRDYRFA